MIFESEANPPHAVEPKAKPVRLSPSETRARKRLLAAREKVRPVRDKNRKHATLLSLDAPKQTTNRSFYDESMG